MKDSSEAIDLSQLETEQGEDVGDSGPEAVPNPGVVGSRPARSMKLRAAKEDLGRADGLRHTILTLVADEEYARAISRMKEFQASKDDFPQFAVRAGRYVSYAVDLINGIKAKRSFPGVHTLAMSKQQELYDRAMDHFHDLTATLRKIEQIDREVRAEDTRSTVWIVQALLVSVLAILILAFVREVSRGVLPSAGFVFNDMFDRATNWIFDSLGM
ncbi:MAG: hypothetical protein NDI61_12945 [Bdellovibrionaceae bacterium]|nr:hypothetical protein [Pseudobdellovibrionaceae bacterium]